MKSKLLTCLIVAAIIAVFVFIIQNASGAEAPATVTPTPTVESLAKEVADLKAQLAQAKAEVAAWQAAAAKLEEQRNIALNASVQAVMQQAAQPKP